MWLDDRHSTRWLIPYVLAAAALGAGCSFQPSELSAGPGGAAPDAMAVIPDATANDATMASDADIEMPDAGRDGGTSIDLTIGLMAHWPLDVIEGEEERSTPDVVGGFTGEVRGTATIVPESLNGALSLDGSSGFVRIDDVPQLDFTGIITLAAWCRPRATDGIRSIITHGTTFGPNGEVYLRIEGGEYQAGSWNGGDHRALLRVPDEDIDTWVHLAGVYDGTTWRLYRNGEEVDTGGDIGALPTEEDWAIGARSRSDVDRYFEGEIDDVRIYKRVLSPVEIGALVALRPL
jgi:hypothetical protein